MIWFFLLAFAPVFFMQGLYTKRVAKRLPDAQPPSSGVYGQDTGSVQVLGFGDSVIAGTGLENLSESLTAQLARELYLKNGQPVKWRACGQNGDKLKDLLVRTDQLPEIQPDLVVISVGVNDVTRLTKILDWRRDLHALTEKLRSFSVCLVFIALPPMECFPVLPFPLRWFLGLRASMLDYWLKRETDLYSDVFYVDYGNHPVWLDMAGDGYHPSEFACKKLAAKIARIARF